MEKIYIAAGGTGGHINAALSMGEVFGGEFEIEYLSGTRYLDYQLFNNKKCLHFDSKPLRTKNPITLLINVLLNIYVFVTIFLLYLSKRPVFIIGAGGYICGPTLLAGKFLGIPVFIIEQNAVVGMTNKILANFADLIFTNFERTRGIKKSKKVIQAGNPIRSNIKTSANNEKSELNILIFGGSLGATQINKALELVVKTNFGRKLNILHQVGKNNKNEGLAHHETIEYSQVEYIDDMNKKYEWSNIIISRAGASTVSELRVVKRPVIIIPYPAATDNHQYHNAIALKEEDGFFVDVLDHKLENQELSEEIGKALTKIITQNLYYTNETDITSAAEKIKSEIKKYVRN